jgi:hypothetical protein
MNSAEAMMSPPLHRGHLSVPTGMWIFLLLVTVWVVPPRPEKMRAVAQCCSGVGSAARGIPLLGRAAQIESLQ